jgi:hypothetical protein
MITNVSIGQNEDIGYMWMADRVGGNIFFSTKKIFWFPMLLKKYSDFGGGRKK